MSSRSQIEGGNPLLLLSLWELFKTIRGQETDEEEVDMNLPERYTHFVKYSTHGASCGFALKCIDLFMRKDYERVRAAFLRALEEFRKIEGDSFGK